MKPCGHIKVIRYGFVIPAVDIFKRFSFNDFAVSSEFNRTAHGIPSYLKVGIHNVFIILACGKEILLCIYYVFPCLHGTDILWLQLYNQFFNKIGLNSCIRIKHKNGISLCNFHRIV